ncbi:chromate transporter [Domibacillus sp. 8LH]
MKQLFDIFLTFFKLSPITFGGGYALIPVIQREIVEKTCRHGFYS